jgi:hypothetical protein
MSTPKKNEVNSAIKAGIVQGLVLWAAGVASVRFTPESFWVGISKQKIGVMASVPLMVYITTKSMKSLNGWKSGTEVFAGVTAGTVAAMYFDGLAHAFMPNLYSPSRAVNTGGAGWIFLGAAFFISEGFRHMLADEAKSENKAE